MFTDNLVHHGTTDFASWKPRPRIIPWRRERDLPITKIGKRWAMSKAQSLTQLEENHFDVESAHHLPKFEEETVGDHERSSRDAARYRRRRYIIMCVAVTLQLLTHVVYLVLRVRYQVRWRRQAIESLWSILLLMCDGAYFLTALMGALDYLLPNTPRPKCFMKDEQSYPTVDIFIPCCKEPTDIPKESILAALAVKYPRDLFRVCVLDDGGDDDLKAFCEQMQLGKYGKQILYLRRQKVPGVPHNFKCGNLNFGLQHSTADYVAIIDADMILHREFLRELIPYSVNSPEAAFVQIPQCFYNLPAGDPLFDSCLVAYDQVAVLRDAYAGLATCIGTGAIFKRKCLDEIGGFQPQTITEDTTTSYFLFNHGYRSVYLKKKLQIGLVPWTFEGYVKQRQRWAQGAFQQFVSTWRAMLGPKSRLSPMQKLLYLWHSGSLFISIVNVILLSTLFYLLLFPSKMSLGDREGALQILFWMGVNQIACKLVCVYQRSELPQPMVVRNREESHFWWMVPFYCETIRKGLISYKSTFQFIPTSSVDRAAGTGTTGHKRTKLEELKLVRFHVAFVVLVLPVVLWKAWRAVTRVGLTDCRYSFSVVSLSIFFVAVCAHMYIPIGYILHPTSYKPEDRRSLLKYDAEGVPIFSEKDCLPDFHWSVWIVEVLRYVQVGFWAVYIYVYLTGLDREWCQELYMAY